MRHLGGVLNIIVRPVKYRIWLSHFVDDRNDLFENHFPNIDSRANVSGEPMQQFVDALENICSLVWRIKSIATSIIDTSQVAGDSDPQHENTVCRRRGGVVIVGDAVHSFLQNTEQGICDLLEDVTVLLNVIYTLGAVASMDFVERGYEGARDE